MKVIIAIVSSALLCSVALAEEVTTPSPCSIVEQQLVEKEQYFVQLQQALETTKQEILYLRGKRDAYKELNETN